MNFARNHIIDICIYSRHAPIFYANIVILDLSENNIYLLAKNCFVLMSDLVTLDLHDNPLHYLQELSFNGLKYLKILNLMNTQLLEMEILASQIYGTESII